MTTINGTDLPDTLTGGAGDDTITGLAGNDTIDGGAGQDLLYGGAGDDILDGNVGNDTLLGEGGNDRLTDNQGSNLLDGGDGDDQLQSIVLEGAITLIGGAGQDSLLGFAPSSLLIGGSGDDQVSATGEKPDEAAHIFVQHAEATLSGGMGSDTLGASWLRQAVLQGDEGDDSLTAFYSKNATLEGGGGNDRLLAIFNDSFNAYFGESKGVNYLLDGGAGDDQLEANNYNAYGWNGIVDLKLLGGEGNDSLVVNPNANGRVWKAQLEGGQGNDTLSGENVLQLTYTGGAGRDIFVLKAAQYRALQSGPATLVSTQAYSETTGWTDSTTITVSPQATVITDFTAGADGDVLNVRELLLDCSTNFDGSNPFSSGHIQLVQSGNDTLLQFDQDGSGGAGHTAQTVAVLQNVAASQLTASNFSPTFPPDGGLIPGQTVSGTDGNDSLAGADGGDLLQGFAGNDTLDGLFGNDTLIGGDGDDQLLDTMGVNLLDGGSGNDILSGNALSQVLIGGDGNDNLQANGEKPDNPGLHVYVQHAEATLSGGTGSDTLGASWLRQAVLQGDEGDDSLTAFYSKNATLEGGGGNDRLLAIFNDSFNSYFGESKGVIYLLDGGAGDDQLEANNYNAYGWNGIVDLRLLGGEGNDSLVVNPNAGGRVWKAQLDGAQGNDTLSGENVLQLTYTGGAGRDIFVLKAAQYRALQSGPATLVSTQAYSETTGWTDSSSITVSPQATVITDFAAGTDGDMLDISEILQSIATSYDGTNPFSSGHLHIEQVGADTLLSFDADGAAGTANSFVTIAVLKNVTASALVAANFSPNFSLERVTRANSSPTGEVTIAGQPVQGQTLA